VYYHASWQNDICSFRAVTVGLTVSFKTDKFFTFILVMMMTMTKPIIRIMITTTTMITFL